MSEIRTYIFDVGDTDFELPFNTQLVTLADYEAAIEAEYNLRLKNVAQLSDVNTQLKAENEWLKEALKEACVLGINENFAREHTVERWKKLLGEEVVGDDNAHSSDYCPTCKGPCTYWSCHHPWKGGGAG